MVLFRKAQLYSSTFLINTFCLLVGVYSESDGQLIFLLQGQQGGVMYIKRAGDLTFS